MRIVVETKTGFANFEGNRLEFDSSRDMFFCYNGDSMVGAFDCSGIMKIYISRKGESSE